MTRRYVCSFALSNYDTVQAISMTPLSTELVRVATIPLHSSSISMSVGTSASGAERASGVEKASERVNGVANGPLL